MFQGADTGEGKYKSILRSDFYDSNVLIYEIEIFSIDSRRLYRRKRWI